MKADSSMKNLSKTSIACVSNLLTIITCTASTEENIGLY